MDRSGKSGPAAPRETAERVTFAEKCPSRLQGRARSATVVCVSDRNNDG